MSLPLVLPLITLTLSTGMAAAIVARDPGLRIQRLLGALLAATAWWSLCEVVWQLQSKADDVLFYVRLSSLGWMALGSVSLHIFAEISGRPRALMRTVPVAYACAAFGVVTYLMTPAVERAVWTEAWGWGYELGLVFAVPYAIVVTPPTVMLAVWHRFYPDRAIAGGERLVSRWMYAGVATALAVTFLTEVLLPSLRIQWLHLGTASISLLAISCAITLNRYGYSLLSPAAFAEEILGTLGDGVALVYVDGRIRFANRALEELAGAERQALRGRPVQALLPGVFEAVEGSDAVELDLVADDGARVPVAVSAVRLESPASTSLVVRDQREVRSLRERIVTSGRLATVGELSSAIARETRRPAARTGEQLLTLRKIWGEASIAARDAGEAERLGYLLSEGEELIDECIEGVARVGSIARAMGSFESGRADDSDLADLNAIVEDGLRVASGRLPAGIVLERELADLPRVRCSSREIGQVVLNLVMNAFDAVEGQGRVCVRTGLDAPSFAWIEVEDDGPGISADIRQRIFDPFFTTKPVGEGTGLGLAICFHIVERHAGELHCDSEPGAGTRIRVRLPLDRPA